MFKITGILAGKETSVTWDAGKIDHPQVLKAVQQVVNSLEGDVYTSVTHQLCFPVLEDSLFCYEQIKALFSEVTDEEGDSGLISEEGVVY